MGFIRKLFGFKKKSKHDGVQNGDPNVIGLHDGEQGGAIFPRKVHLRKSSEDAQASAPSPAQQRPASADVAALRQQGSKSFSGSLKRGSFMPPTTPRLPPVPPAMQEQRAPSEGGSEKAATAPHALLSDCSHAGGGRVQPTTDPPAEEEPVEEYTEVPGEAPTTAEPAAPPAPPPRDSSGGSFSRAPKVLKTSSLAAPPPELQGAGWQAPMGAPPSAAAVGRPEPAQPAPRLQEISSSVVCSLGELDADDSPRVCETKARMVTDHAAFDQSVAGKRAQRMSFLPDDDPSPTGSDEERVPAEPVFPAPSLAPQQPAWSGPSSSSGGWGGGVQERAAARPQPKPQPFEQPQQQPFKQPQQQPQQQPFKQQRQHIKEAPAPQRPPPPPRSSHPSHAAPPAQSLVIPDLQADEALMFSPESTGLGCSGWRSQGQPHDEAASGAETEMSPSRYGSPAVGGPAAGTSGEGARGGGGGSVLAEGNVAKLQKKKKEFVDRYVTLSIRSGEEVGDGEDRQGVDFCYLLEVHETRGAYEGGEAPAERSHVTGASVKFVQGTVFTVKTTADLNKKALTHFLSTDSVDEARSWFEAFEMVPDCTVDWVGNEGVSLKV